MSKAGIGKCPPSGNPSKTTIIIGVSVGVVALVVLILLILGYQKRIM